MYRSPRGSFRKEADAVSAVTAYAAQAAHFILPVIALIVLIRCIASMFYGRAEPETWGHLVTPDGKVYPLLHWECLIGRARSADITLPYADVANVHAVLMRNDAGEWTVSDLSRSGGVYLNGEQITEPTQVFSGDILRCSTHMLKFADMSEERRAVQEQRRTIAGRKVSAGGTLFFLTVFQLLLALEFVSSADSAHLLGILMSFAALVLTQWFCYVLMRTMDRSGFEVETIAFFLCTLGLEICATSTPDDLTKEIILIIVGIALFFLLGWWLRDLSHVKALRWPAAIISLALPSIASLMLWTRRYVVDQMNSDYVKFAKAKGLNQREIFSGHIFKNAVIPIAQGIPASLAACITGAIITESIYSVGGMGKMLPNAINQYNNVMIVALAFIFSTVSVLSVLAGDIVLTKVDPRISLSEKAGRS